MTDLTDADMDRLLPTYWHWQGIATLLRCPYQPDLVDTDIGLVGVPYSGGNTIERMQYLGPRAVRNRSASYHRSHRAFGIDPFAIARVRDLGDAPVARTLNPDMAAADFQAFYEKVFAAGIVPVSVGGDHSITWPILRAARATRFAEPVGMIHFDSHTDAYPAGSVSRNNAAGFRTGAEDGVIDPKRTVQIGMHGPMASLDCDDWAKENFARVIPMDRIVEEGTATVVRDVREVVGDGPVYLSIDLDVIDPAFAPAVADPEVNGLTTRELMAILHGFRGLNLIGADVVCYCPPLDNPAQTTALVVSELLLEFVTLIADARSRGR